MFKKTLAIAALSLTAAMPSFALDGDSTFDELRSARAYLQDILQVSNIVYGNTYEGSVFLGQASQEFVARFGCSFTRPDARSPSGCTPNHFGTEIQRITGQIVDLKNKEAVIESDLAEVVAGIPVASVNGNMVRFTNIIPWAREFTGFPISSSYDYAADAAWAERKLHIVEGGVRDGVLDPNAADTLQILAGLKNVALTATYMNANIGRIEMLSTELENFRAAYGSSAWNASQY